MTNVFNVRRYKELLHIHEYALSESLKIPIETEHELFELDQQIEAQFHWNQKMAFLPIFGQYLRHDTGAEGCRSFIVQLYYLLGTVHRDVTQFQEQVRSTEKEKVPDLRISTQALEFRKKIQEIENLVEQLTFEESSDNSKEIPEALFRRRIHTIFSSFQPFFQS